MFLRVSTQQRYNTSGPSEFFISALFMLICVSLFLELFKEQTKLVYNKNSETESEYADRG